MATIPRSRAMHACACWLFALLATVVLAGPASAALFAVDELDSLIVQLDPDSGALLNTFSPPVPTGAGPNGLASDGHSLYFSTASFLFELDPTTGAVRASLPAPAAAMDGLGWGVTSFGATLFAAYSLTDTVFLLDPKTGVVLTSFTTPFDLVGAIDFDAARGTLFAAGLSLVYELNATSGAVIASFAPPTAPPTGIGFDRGRLFVANGTGMIQELDPGSGVPLGLFGAPFSYASALAGTPAGFSLTFLDPAFTASELARLDFEAGSIELDAAADLYLTDTANDAGGSVEILRLTAPDYDDTPPPVFFSYPSDPAFCCPNGVALSGDGQELFVSVRSSDGEAGAIDVVDVPGASASRYADLETGAPSASFRASGLTLDPLDAVVFPGLRESDPAFGALYTLSGPAPPVLSLHTPDVRADGVAEDSGGRLYVAVRSGTGLVAESIYRYEAFQAPRRIASFATRAPSALAVDAQGHVYGLVVDPVEGATRILKLTGPPPLGLVITDQAPETLYEGASAPLLRIVLEHLGGPGDRDLELAALGIGLEDDAGLPLSPAEAAARLAALGAARDLNGNGLYEPGVDVVLASAEPPVPVGGVVFTVIPDGDPSVRVAYGAPVTFFVVTRAAPDFGGAPPGPFRATLVAESTRAEDRDYDLSVELAISGDPASALVALASTTQCSDGTDNDGDEQVDHPDDEGCSGPGDDDERSTALACDDGLDNDGDGPIDTQDRGCAVSGGVSEESDRDADGVLDAADNCLDGANPTQFDVDGDGFGNACDADFNQDGVIGAPDFNAFKPCFGQTVPASGTPEDPTCAESDMNGDGVVGAPDFNLFRPRFGGKPGPSGLLGTAPAITGTSVSPSTLGRPDATGQVFVEVGFDYLDPDADIALLRTRLLDPQGAEPIQGWSRFEPAAASGSFVRSLSVDDSFGFGTYQLELQLADSTERSSSTALLSFDVADVPPDLAITGFDTGSAQPGDLVRILGRGFAPGGGGAAASAAPANGGSGLRVRFPGAERSGEIVSVSDTEIEVRVPRGAITGPVALKTPDGSTLSPLPLGVVRTLTLDPEPERLLVDEIVDFNCVSSGTDAELVWTIDGSTTPGPELGSIDAFGVYVAPADPPPLGSIALRCEALDDAAVFDELTIEIGRDEDPAGQQSIVAAEGGAVSSVRADTAVVVPDAVLSEDALLELATLDADQGTVVSATHVPRAALDLTTQAPGALLDGEATAQFALRSWMPPGTSIPMLEEDGGGGFVETGEAATVEEGGQIATGPVQQLGTQVLRNDLPGTAPLFADRLDQHAALLFDIVPAPDLQLLEGLSVPVMVEIPGGSPEGPGPFVPGVSARLRLPAEGSFGERNLADAVGPLLQPSPDGWRLGTVLRLPVLEPTQLPTPEPGCNEGELRDAELLIEYPQAWNGSQTLVIPFQIDCLDELVFGGEGEPPAADLLCQYQAIEPGQPRCEVFDRATIAPYTLPPGWWVVLFPGQVYTFSKIDVAKGGWLSVQPYTGQSGSLPTRIEVTGEVRIEGELRVNGDKAQDGFDGVITGPWHDHTFTGGAGGDPGRLNAGAGGRGGGDYPDEGLDGDDALFGGGGGDGGLVWEKGSFLAAILNGLRLLFDVVTCGVTAGAYCNIEDTIRAAGDFVSEVGRISENDEKQEKSVGDGGGAPPSAAAPDAELVAFTAPQAGGGGGGAGRMRILIERDDAGGGGGGGGGGGQALNLVVNGPVFLGRDAILDGRGGNGGSGGQGDIKKSAPAGGGAGGNGAQIRIIADQVDNNGIVVLRGGLGGPSAISFNVHEMPDILRVLYEIPWVCEAGDDFEGRVCLPYLPPGLESPDVVGCVGGANACQLPNLFHIYFPKGFGDPASHGVLRFDGRWAGADPHFVRSRYEGPSFLKQVIGPGGGGTFVLADVPAGTLHTIVSTDPSPSVVVRLGDFVDDAVLGPRPAGHYCYEARVNGTPVPILDPTHFKPQGADSEILIEFTEGLTPGLNVLEFAVDRTDTLGTCGALYEPHAWQKLYAFHFPTLVDTDGDGLSDGMESHIGTLPGVVDSDGDGLEDGEELDYLGTDPTQADSPLLVLETLDSTNRFGESVAAVGDVSGDDIGDFLVGAPYTGTGFAYLVSGADGAELARLEPAMNTGSDQFGRSVAGIADADGDAVPDLVIGAPHTDVDGRTETGRVFLYSGATRAELQTFDDPPYSDFGGHFGEAVAATAGPLWETGGALRTRFGGPFLVVGAPESCTDSEWAWLYEPDGTLVHRLERPGCATRFGASVAIGASLVEGTGAATCTVAVGAPVAMGSGEVRGFDCVTGALQWTDTGIEPAGPGTDLGLQVKLLDWWERFVPLADLDGPPGLFGAPHFDVGPPLAGRVDVHLRGTYHPHRTTAQTTRSFFLDAPASSIKPTSVDFGDALAFVLNADAGSDADPIRWIAVGVPDLRRVFLYSPDGELEGALVNPEPLLGARLDTDFGFALAASGFRNDGTARLAVAAPEAQKVYVFDVSGYLDDPDADGLTASRELALGSLLDDPDSDDDELLDGEEAVFGTDPMDPDSDDDTYADGTEVFAGSDPTDPLSTP